MRFLPLLQYIMHTIMVYSNMLLLIYIILYSISIFDAYSYWQQKDVPVQYGVTVVSGEG